MQFAPPVEHLQKGPQKMISPTNPSKGRVQATWKRNLIVLWFGELIAMVGFSVFLPFLPLFVQELGISGVKQVAFWSAVVAASQSMSMAVISPVWGMLSDRYGRKIMVERAMFGGAVVIALMGFVSNVYQLAILRLIQGFLTGAVAAATTLVASTAPPERRGFAIGLLQMAIYLGTTMGPALGGLIVDSMGYRATFWVTGGLLFVSGILVMALVREDFTPPHPSARSSLLEGVMLVLRSRPLVFTSGVRMLERMASQIAAPVLALFVQDIAPPGTKIASLTGTMTGFAAGASALGAVTLGRLSDRVGPRRVLIVCSVFACVMSAMQSQVQTPTQLLILRVGTGLAMGGILASISTMLASFTPKGRYGTVYGVDTSLGAGANALAPMIGAALTAAFGLSSVFLGAAVLYALSATVVAVVVPARAEE